MNDAKKNIAKQSLHQEAGGQEEQEDQSEREAEESEEDGELDNKIQKIMSGGEEE